MTEKAIEKDSLQGLEKGRRISWFSCGAASAIATKISSPDIIAYCDTGSEDVDNHRFMLDVEKWVGKKIKILKNPDYKDTWDVWEKRKYISGIAGAPCTGELKVKPRLLFEKPNDIHIFGYTADANDMKRAANLREHYPDLNVETPLIEKGLNKKACIAMLENAGIKPPIVYSYGLPNANCIPCCKATSPAYWAVIRKHYPEEFQRMTELSRKLGVRLTRVDGERVFIDEVPENQTLTKPIAPECDFLCSIAEQTLIDDINED